MTLLVFQFVAGQIVPLSFGIVFVGLALFAPMDKLRDGTRITDSMKKMYWRSFFFTLGVLFMLFGIFWTH